MKNIIKTIALILTFCLACSALFGCSLLEAKEKDFSVSGMTITLTDDFYEKDHISFTKYYESTDALVMVLKEDFSIIGSTISTKEYAELVLKANSLSSDITMSGTKATFTYTNEANGKEYFYKAFCYKGTDAYWMIQFACISADEDKFEPKFDSWADTVVFE